MVRWSNDDLNAYNRRQPNKVSGVASGAEPKHSILNESMAKETGKDAHPIRCIVRITSFRLRLLDERNLADKYFTDSLIYAGILYSDSPKYAQIIVTQERVTERALERTEIVIEG